MRETLVSYAFLLPAMLFFVLFVLVPMGMGVVTSFFRYNMKGMTFTGLSNYMTMFADPVWQKSLVNTLLLVVGSVPITVLFALFVAARRIHLQDPSSDVCSSCLWLRVL